MDTYIDDITNYEAVVYYGSKITNWLSKLDSVIELIVLKEVIESPFQSLELQWFTWAGASGSLKFAPPSCLCCTEGQHHNTKHASSLPSEYPDIKYNGRTRSLRSCCCASRATVTKRNLLWRWASTPPWLPLQTATYNHPVCTLPPEVQDKTPILFPFKEIAYRMRK